MMGISPDNSEEHLIFIPKLHRSIIFLTLNLAIVNCGLQLRQGPVFIYEPPSKVIFLNTTGVNIDCSAHGLPEPSISWLQSDDRSHVVNIPGLLHILSNGTLSFYRFKSEMYRQSIHATTYRCLASNIHGTIVSRTVFVRAVVKQAYDVQVYDEYVIKGNTAVMKCHVPSYVKDFVTVDAWVRSDNYQIKSKDMSKGIYSMYDDGRLHIRNVGVSDNNMAYWCRTKHKLSGELQTSISPGRLIVSEPKNSVGPRIAHTTLEISAPAGGDVELPCAAQSWPKPTYRWLQKQKNGAEEVVAVDNVKFRMIGGSLLIQDVENRGTYTCEAKNNVGTTRATTDVILREQLSVYVVPQYLEVDAGQPVNLTCFASTTPDDMKLMWLKDGTIVSGANSKSDFTLSTEPPYNLYISSVQRHHEGMYQCHASINKDGAQGTAELVLASDSPLLADTFEEKFKHPAETVRISCSSFGSPLPVISWLFNARAIVESSRIRIVVSRNRENNVTSTLTISQLRPEDGGQYKCTARNKAGSIEHKANINVYGPPEVHSMNNISVIDGNDVRLDCYTYGYPVKKISWHRESAVRLKGERYKVFSNGTLIIRKSQPQNDAGTYTCIASGDQQRISSKSVWLRVIVRPLIQPMYMQIVKEGGKVSLTCSIIEGDPPVDIKWTKDGGRFFHSLGIKIVRVEDMSILRIPSVHSVHNGNYTCTATNAAGISNETASIRIKVPPKWKIRPENQSVRTGQKAIFHCVADGYPKPTLKWFRQNGNLNTLLLSDRRYRILENGTMVIQNVTEQSTGIYACSVENGVAPVLSQTVTLKLSYKPHVTPLASKIAKPVGSKAKLKCIGRGDGPFSTKWLMNGDLITEDQSEKYTMNENIHRKSIVSSFIIHNVHQSDSGTYRCVISNLHGAKDATIDLTVQEPPGAPSEFIVKRHDDGLLLKWNKPFSGHIDITNYVLQQRIISANYGDSQSKGSDDTSRWSNVSIPGTMTMFILQGLKRQSRYELRIRARNSVGFGPPTGSAFFKVNKNGTIIVDEPPSVSNHWWPVSSVITYISSAAIIIIILILVILLLIICKKKRKKKVIKSDLKRKTEYKSSASGTVSLQDEQDERKYHSILDGTIATQENYYNTSTLAKRCRGDNEICDFGVSPYATFRVQENSETNEKIYDAFDDTYDHNNYSKNEK